MTLTLRDHVRIEARARDLARTIEQQDAVAELAHRRPEQHAAARKARGARVELVRVRLHAVVALRADADSLADWVQSEGLASETLDRLIAVLDDMGRNA